MTGTVLLVESNTTGTGRDFARQAVELGAHPVMITREPSRYPYLAEDEVEYVVADTADPAEVERIALARDRETGVCAVTTSSEYYVPIAAAVAHKLGRPGPSPEAVAACRDKGTQRAVSQAAGVPVPAFAVARTVEAAMAAARRIGPPVVVKPVRGSGSLGVLRCTDEKQVGKHAAELLGRTTNERGLAAPAEVLVEREIDGTEYSVETFGDAVISLVRKHLGPLPQFVELGHDVPAAVDDRDRELLTGTALRALRALGLGWGAGHVEIRISAGEAFLIEVNPRLAGGRIPDLVRLSTGIDLVRAQVAAAMGSEERPLPRIGENAAIRFLTAENAGVLADTEAALEAAGSVTGVVDAAFYHRTGDPVAPAADFRDRCGHVIAVAGGHGTAGEAAELGLGRLRAALSSTEDGDRP
ncbi:ATP-grasp domain-containing protein [Amycolatopsis sp. CA-230715]|uniref:ATP-grasp domain-containing protein n=1 Tax=Amycolatopsis sp. CA-230715 TaxID=2745196 RepID=UPI001C015C3D|nr:ATP-grasp domain-containing protein [Amycolatopsis sp. CA-230715]QWF84505.1 D-alanine--D-alanine ligase [Amycolatopsis sp. CA-230715]